MNEDMQQQFVSWLAQKLGAKDEQDLKAKMQQLGNDGIKQAYNSFMQEQQQSGGDQQVPQQLQGGKLDYLRCLQAYKKGGKAALADCGCTKEMKSGGRVDKNEDATTKNYVGERRDGKDNGLTSKQYSRGSADKASTDKNPGKKDYMSKGKKKEWTTARPKSGVSNAEKEWTTALTKVPKGKEGMVSPEQQKIINLDRKEKGTHKKQDGGMLGKPAKKLSKKQQASMMV